MSGRQVSLFATGFKFPEGPAFDRNKNLFVVNIDTGDISKISPKGQVKVFVNTGGAPNGAQFHPNGDLYVADRAKGIIAISPNGNIRVVVNNYQGKKFNGPNDLVFDSAGNLYFTDPHGSSAENPWAASEVPKILMCWPLGSRTYSMNMLIAAVISWPLVRVPCHDRSMVDR